MGIGRVGDKERQVRGRQGPQGWPDSMLNFNFT